MILNRCGLVPTAKIDKNDFIFSLNLIRNLSSVRLFAYCGLLFYFLLRHQLSKALTLSGRTA